MSRIGKDNFNPHYHCIVLEGIVVCVEGSFMETLRVFGGQLRPDSRLKPESTDDPGPVYHQAEGAAKYIRFLCRRFYTTYKNYY
jgi:hypothetical protein